MTSLHTSLALIRIGIVFLPCVMIFGVIFIAKHLVYHESLNARVADRKLDQRRQNFLADESQLTADMRELRWRPHVGAGSNEISDLQELVVEDKIPSDRAITQPKRLEWTVGISAKHRHGIASRQSSVSTLRGVKTRRRSSDETATSS